MNIIEDKSPYYVKFQLSSLEQIVALVNQEEKNNWRRDNPQHDRNHMLYYSGQAFVEYPSIETRRKIIDLLPWADQLNLKQNSMVTIISEPGVAFLPHKDGGENPLYYCINIPIYIKDDACATNWFVSDSIPDPKSGDVFEHDDQAEVDIAKVVWIRNVRKSSGAQVCSTTLGANEVILMNPNLPHNWDNSKSSNYRVVLSIRPFAPLLTFNQAAEIIRSS